MAIDDRYADWNYDPFVDRNTDPYLPEDPGPYPGDPYGTGDSLYEYTEPVGPPLAAPLPTEPTPQPASETQPPPPPAVDGPPPPVPVDPPPAPVPQPVESPAPSASEPAPAPANGAVAPLAPTASPVPVTASAENPGGSASVGALDGGLSDVPFDLGVSNLSPELDAPVAAGPTWNDVVAVLNQPRQPSPMEVAYQDALQRFLGRAQTTPSLDDADLSPQVEQYRVQAQRNQERNRAAAVQRASVNGQNNSGYLNNAILRGIEEQGFNEAGFNANLLSEAFDKQRGDLQAALQLAAATGNQEAQRDLQRRLAQVNAAMQQQGMNSQDALGWGNLDLRRELGLADLDLREALGWGGLDLQHELGWGDIDLRQALADLQNNQFYDALGVNTALGLEGLNQSALQRILNGLG